MNIYLVINTDYDGDSVISVITKEAFDWINKPYEGKCESHFEEIIPDYVTVWEDAIEDANNKPLQVYTTTGSCQNDRALMINSNVEGFKPYYSDFVSFFKSLNNKVVTVVDVFAGSIY